MIIGTCFLASTAGQRTRLTPWFPRGADNAIFMFEEIFSDLSAQDAYSIDVYHKDHGDPGSYPGSPTVTETTLSTTGFTRLKVEGLKEMVRFAITLAQTEGPGESLVFRFLPPVWYATAQT